MQNMHPQAEKLLAYVDQQLSSNEMAEIKALLAHDPDAVAFVEKLQQIELPFAESFDFFLDQEVPEHFNKTKKQNLRWQWATSIVASLVVGLTLGYYASKINNEDHDNWIVRVADYHLLYVRDTVIETHLSSSEISDLKNKLGKALNTSLKIPDLSAQKLKFKRGQILDANGKPLIQLAYLPQDGLPVALCILQSNVIDSLPKSGVSRGLPYVEWSKNGLSYVIIGKINQQQLEAAALNAASQIAG